MPCCGTLIQSPASAVFGGCVNSAESSLLTCTAVPLSGSLASVSYGPRTSASSISLPSHSFPIVPTLFLTLMFLIHQASGDMGH